ncbi:MAG: diguanylate cyclase, partial [Candidatus Obscuribacterales bacterium]|nr:diguanylate cyclase [Candidatus Obscuribacterales bacterium]
ERNSIWSILNINRRSIFLFFIALSLNALAMLAAYLAFLGMPLYKLLGKLGPGQDISDGYPPYVASELAAISDGVKQRFSSLKEDHEKNLSAARSDLSGQFVKEVEDRFINKLANELVTMTKSDVVYDLIIHRLKDEFIGVIKYAFGFEFIQSEENQYQILHQWNLSDENLKVLEGLANSQFSVLAKKLNNPVLLSKDELASKRLEQLITDLGCDQALVIPMDLQRKEKAYICFFMVNKDQQTMQKLERIAMRISEQVSPLWQLVARYEEAYKLSRHDALTSLKNRVSLEEKLQQWNVVASEDGKSESVFLVFEGDNFRVMLNSYGPRTIDRLIQELAEQIVASLEQAVRFKKASSRIDFAKYMYRVGGCRFLLILEDSSLKKALELAEQVSQSVAERRDWAHGLPSWSVSCGVSALVPGKTTPEDTFEEATITLEHIRSRKSTALVMQSSEVPEEFMSRAQSRNRSDVENIEPAALLQQLSQSKKTGILTVSDAGKIFWAYIENGY